MKKIKAGTIFDPNCGRNDGAPLYMLESMKRNKDVSVDLYRPVGDINLWPKYDFYLWVDFADDALGFQDFPMPENTFFWSSDYHISPESYAHRLKRAKQARWIGCYQKRNVEEFIKDGIPEDRIFWLPPAFEPSCYRPGLFKPEVKDMGLPIGEHGWIDCDVMKRYDICFIGHINNPKRADALDYVFKQIPNFFYGTKIFEKCAMIYNQSKIVFNIAHLDDVNMRVPEVLGTRSFLLTEDIPTLHELYQDGVHLVTYKSLEDAVEKAKYYIEHDEEREKIASAGYELAKSRDTYDHRLETILKYTELYERELVEAI